MDMHTAHCKCQKHRFHSPYLLFQPGSWQWLSSLPLSLPPAGLAHSSAHSDTRSLTVSGSPEYERNRACRNKEERDITHTDAIHIHTIVPTNVIFWCKHLNWVMYMYVIKITLQWNGYGVLLITLWLTCAIASKYHSKPCHYIYIYTNALVWWLAQGLRSLCALWSKAFS